MSWLVSVAWISMVLWDSCFYILLFARVALSHFRVCDRFHGWNYILHILRAPMEFWQEIANLKIRSQLKSKVNWRPFNSKIARTVNLLQSRDFIDEARCFRFLYICHNILTGVSAATNFSPDMSFDAVWRLKIIHYTDVDHSLTWIVWCRSWDERQMMGFWFRGRLNNRFPWMAKRL